MNKKPTCLACETRYIAKENYHHNYDCGGNNYADWVLIDNQWRAPTYNSQTSITGKGFGPEMDCLMVIMLLPIIPLLGLIGQCIKAIIEYY